MAYRNRGRYVCFGALLWVILSTYGCDSVPIAEDISQAQAREVVAVLSEQGIDGIFHRKRNGVGSFFVEVSSKDFPAAVRILHEKGIPESSSEEVLATLSKSSFLPDSRLVEGVRLDFVRAMQLEGLLENFPDVISAKVMLRLHLRDAAKQSGGRDRESVTGAEQGASVVLRVKDASLIPRAEIEKLLHSIVPELEPEKIHLAIFTHESAKQDVEREPLAGPHIEYSELFFGWKVAKEDYPAIALSLLGTILLVGIAGVMGGYWFGVLVRGPRDRRTALDSFRGGEPLSLQPFTYRDEERRFEDGRDEDGRFRE